MDMVRGLVLGAGSPLHGDQAFGTACTEAFLRRYESSRQLTVTDVGMQGLYLVDLLRKHDVAVVFDAVDFGAEPGSLFRVYDDDIRGFLARHPETQAQACLRESIACAHLLGGCARWMLLVAIQPVSLAEVVGEMDERLRIQIPEALVIAVEYLDFCEVRLRPRSPRPVEVAVAAPPAPAVPAPGKSLIRIPAPRHGDTRRR